MAKIKLLIDTDILIDSLRGVKVAKDIFDDLVKSLFCPIFVIPAKAGIQ